MKKDKDSLGNRVKTYYENRTRFYLPRRTYTIIRIDGKSFHSFTKNFERPFDQGFIEDMDATACYLCKNIQGAKFAFVQSDEISILLTDFEQLSTDAWFDGNIQKMTSISASLATAKFNQLRTIRASNQTLIEDHGLSFGEWFPEELACFDSRVFTIPSSIEVENYFIWRQQDTTRNSISSVAQSLYNYKELKNKNCAQMQEMIFQKGINWNDYPVKLKRGRLVIKKDYELNNSIRNKWVSTDPDIFTENRNMLRNLIPIL